MAALDKSALSELLDAIRPGDGTDVLNEAMRIVLQELIEAEGAETIGAQRYERSDSRTSQRNGTRDRLLSTPAGDVALKIPKLRVGSFFPSLLEPRRRIDKALWAVVMEAYVFGCSTRKVDDLVQALGVSSGIKKSEVSRICKELDQFVEAFRSRDLSHTDFPYVFLDATFVKARQGPHVVSKAVVIATGVATSGHREVLGLDVGDSEDGQFWREFLTSLKGRGLTGVTLVISDAHEGLKSAIEECFIGVAWQRCRVHFMRNALSRAPKADAQMVKAAISTVFAQLTSEDAHAQLTRVADGLTSRFPKVAEMLESARYEILAYAAFPISHWRKIWSTNPLERLNKEIKRRTNVVGIFPNDAAVIRLVGAVLADQNDEWQDADRRYLSESSMAMINDSEETLSVRLTRLEIEPVVEASTAG